MIAAPAYPAVTSVTARQDIYGAKVVAAPVLAGEFVLFHGAKSWKVEKFFWKVEHQTKSCLLLLAAPAYVAGPAIIGKGVYGGHGLVGAGYY